MSDLLLKLLLEVSVAIMLGITIYYCIKLNKRIQILQDSKSELAQLIMKFDESTQQATQSIVEIQKASKKINDNIQEKLNKANFIADDLAFMIERGNKMADQMEGQIAGSRKVAAPATPKKEAVMDEKTEKAQRAVRMARRPSREDRESAKDEMMQEAQAKASGGKDAADKKGIEAMMNRISELKSGKTEEKKHRPIARMRTKSERDLLDALQKKEV